MEWNACGRSPLGNVSRERLNTERQYRDRNHLYRFAPDFPHVRAWIDRPDVKVEFANFVILHPLPQKGEDAIRDCGDVEVTLLGAANDNVLKV